MTNSWPMMVFQILTEISQKLKNVLYLKNMHDGACSEISSNAIYYNQTMVNFLLLPDKSLENNTS